MFHYVMFMAYFYFYIFWYGWVVVLGRFALDRFSPRLGSTVVQGLDSLIVIVGLAMLALAWRRADHAARSYGNRDLSLLQAHRAAGALLGVDLSYLPLVGHFFGSERDQG